MDWIKSLDDGQIKDVAEAVETGHVNLPCTKLGIQKVLQNSPNAHTVAQELNKLHDAGFGPKHIAGILQAVMATREDRPKLEDLVNIVLSGPDTETVVSKDTGNVVKGLFMNAKREVLIAGYAVHQGKKVFASLADQMERNQDLHVRFYLDIVREKNDKASDSELALRLANVFRQNEWPKGKRLPILHYYDPGRLNIENKKTKGCLHAKVVVVDGESVFVSSANFTEAAQERNIEVGLLLNSRTVAGQIQKYFEEMVHGEYLKILPNK